MSLLPNMPTSIYHDIFTAISSTNINRNPNCITRTNRQMDELETHQYGIRCIHQGAVNWIIRVGRTSANRMT